MQRERAKVPLSSALGAIGILMGFLRSPDVDVFELKEFGQAPRNRVVANSADLIITEIINRVQERDLLMITARSFPNGVVSEESLMIDPDVVTYPLALEHLVLDVD